MTEVERPDQGPNISPSNRRTGLPLGETLRRSVSSANFPPLDHQEEGPSESDRHLSNAEMQEIATIVAAVMKKERKWYRDPLLFTAGALFGVGAALGVDKLSADEPISEPTPASRDIGSVDPTSFTDDSLIDDRLVPRAEAETKKVNPDEVLTNKAAEKIKRNSNPNAIKAKKFDIAPPNRAPSENMSSQYIPIDQLPTIKEHTADYSRDGTYNNFQPGIGFMLEGRPPVSYTTRRVTPKGIELVETKLPYNATIGINGYAIGKEIQPDGNVFLAVYAPGKNGLPKQDNIENSLLSVENITDDGNEGKISNAIVWLKAENFEGHSPPFSFYSGWDESSINSPHTTDKKVTNIPEELFRYIEIGDPVRAGALPQIPHWAPELLVKNYQKQKSHLTYDEAQEKYLNTVNSNAETMQRMLEDAKTGGVTLKEQFETKRYILQVSSVKFVVPRD